MALLVVSACSTIVFIVSQTPVRPEVATSVSLWNLPYVAVRNSGGGGVPCGGCNYRANYGMNVHQHGDGTIVYDIPAATGAAIF